MVIVEARKQQHRLSKDQLDQLRERRRTEEAAAESALRELYTAIWLPRVDVGTITIEKVEKDTVFVVKPPIRRQGIMSGRPA